MKKLLIFFLLIISSLQLFSQDLLTPNPKSKYTYYYQISNMEAYSLYFDRYDESIIMLLHTLVDSSLTTAPTKTDLSEGHYLKVYAENDKFHYDLFTVSTISAQVTNNGQDLSVVVFDQQGNQVSNAEVKVNCEIVKYNKKTKSYYLKKNHREGVLSVKLNGVRRFYELKNNPYPYTAIGIKALAISDFYFTAKADILGGRRKSDYSHYYNYLKNRIDYLYELYFETDKTDRNDFRLSSRHNSMNTKSGFFVLNKPMYKPTDTLKLKAYLFKYRTGKKLNKKIDLYIDAKSRRSFIKIARLNPYARGAYEYSFPLHDSLNLSLDREYTLKLVSRGLFKKMYMSENFRYEDYELKANTVNISLNQKTYYTGDTLNIIFSGSNEIGFPVVGAKAKVKLKIYSVDKVFNPLTFVSDTFVLDTVLYTNDLGLCTLSVPSSILPNANISCNVLAEVLLPNNELHSFDKEFKYNYLDNRIITSLYSDSISFKLLQNGIENTANARLTAYSKYNQFIDTKTINLPCQLAIDTRIASYTFDINAEKVMINLDTIKPELFIISDVEKKQMNLSVRNEQMLDFTYFLFEDNELIEKGNSKTFDYSSKVNGKHDYFVTLQYLWAGEMISESTGIKASKQKGYSILVKQDEILTPGQKSKIEIEVLQNNKPVKNADVTAMAITAKFKDPNYPLTYSYSPDALYKQNNNSYSTKNLSSSSYFNLSNSSARLIPGLTKQEYYQFMFPDSSIFSKSYPVKDSLTQFAAFVFHDGVKQQVFSITVGKELVYVGYGKQFNPYSFAVDSGFHSVLIRTVDRELFLPRVYFEANKKTIISVDDYKYDNSKIKICGSELSSNDKEIINNSVIYVKDNFKNNKAYLLQEGRVFLLDDLFDYSSENSKYSYRDNYESIVIAPIKFRDISLLTGKTKPYTFNPENLYEYDFSDTNKLRLRFKPSNTINAIYRQQIKNYSLLDEVITEQKLLRMINSYNHSNSIARNNEDRYVNSVLNKANGKLNLNIDNVDNDSIKFFPLNIIVYDAKSDTIHSIHNGSKTIIGGLKTGMYRLCFLFEDGRFGTMDSVYIKENGTTYLKNFPILIQPLDAEMKLIDALFATFSRMPNIPENVIAELSNIKAVYGEKLFSHADSLNKKEINCKGNVLKLKLIDSYSKPIIGAEIRVLETKELTRSDLNGDFQVKLLKPKSKLFICSPYFKPIVLTVNTNKSYGDAALVLESIPLNYEYEIISKSESVMKYDLLSTVTTITGSYSSVEKSKSSKSKMISMDYGPALNKSGQNQKPINSAQYLQSKNDKDSENLNYDAGLNTSSLRSNFSDYAYWQPRLKTDKHGKVSFEVQYPDDITKWNTAVIATKGKHKFGMYRSDVKVYKNVLGQLYCPRFLLENDTVQLSSKLTNYNKDSLQISSAFFADNHQISSRSLLLTSVNYDSCTSIANSINDSIKFKYLLSTATGYFDGEERKVPILPIGLNAYVGKFLVLENDTTISFNQALGETHVYISSNELNLLEQEIQYLMNYEYACNEQLASKLIALLNNKQLCAYYGREFKHDKDINKIIKKLIANLNEQNEWGWWGKSESADWITIHVQTALKKAQAANYNVAYSFSNSYQNARLELDNNISDALKISILLRLKESNIDIDYPKYIKQINSSQAELKTHKKVERNSLSVYQQIQLIRLNQLCALPYSINDLNKFQKNTMFGNLYFGDTITHSIMYSDLNSTLIAYKIIKTHNSKAPELTKIRNWLYETRGLRSWTNTYQSAQIIETILPDLMSSNKVYSSVQLKFTGDLNQTVTNFPFELTKNMGDFTITKTGSAPVYFTAYQVVWDSMPDKKETDFIISSQFASKTNVLNAGEPVKLQVEVEVKKDAEYTQIDIPIPAGCTYESKSQSYFAYEVHREFYKDRVSIFCQKIPAGKYSFNIELLPKFKGSFTLNPAQVKLMYFPLFNANNEIKRVIIK